VQNDDEIDSLTDARTINDGDHNFPQIATPIGRGSVHRSDRRSLGQSGHRQWGVSDPAGRPRGHICDPQAGSLTPHLLHPT
jgi:hypothetical protein